ncbi:MAG: flagellar protein FlaI, partial [Crenarchaeota archaeon]|nr:flagellar protein FlaI [Thermoproteota archaeon]
IPVALHNTGHPVMATFHAANLERLIQRLTNPPINVPKTNMDSLNIAWFQSAVYSKTGLLVRRVITINEIVGYDPESDAISAIPVFTWDPATDQFRFAGRGSSYLLEEKIAVMKGISRRDIKLIYEELDLRAKYLRLLVDRNIVDYFKVFKAIVKAYQLGVEEAYKKLLRGDLML